MYDSYIVKRTQIHIDEAQEAQLARRARAEGSTKSALIRRAIDAYLDDAGDEQLQLTRFRSAVEAAAGVAPDLAQGTVYVERLRALDAERQDALARRRRE